MSRLLTCGFEMGYVGQGGGAAQPEDPLLATGGNASGTVAAVTTDRPRSGQYSLKNQQSGTSGSFALQAPLTTGVLTRTYWSRVAVNYGAFGTSGISDLVSTYNSGLTGGMRVKIRNTGVLTVTNYAGTTLLTGPTLALNTWYVLEWSQNLSTGAGQFWVDGVSYGTYTTDIASTGTPVHILWCPSGPSGGHLMWFDDWAINDDQGTSQNGQIGNQGKIVLLKPISDNARVGFTGGAGGTANLFQAVDNIPPTGLVLASATATSQIKDATSNTTDSYTANLAAYSTAVASGGGGIGATDPITLVQGVVNHGNSSTTSRTNGLTVVSNPAIAEATGGTGTTAAGTWPTGWPTLKSAVSYAPSVTKGTSPTIKFRKGTASTDSSMSDLMGLCVEYIPVLPQPLTIVAQAAASASVAVATKQPLTPTAQAVVQVTNTVVAKTTLTPTAVASSAQAIATVNVFAQVTPTAVAASQASAVVNSPQSLTPIAQATAQATSAVRASTLLDPVSRAVSAATTNITARHLLDPSATALAQTFSLVSTSAPPLIPVSAGAQSQATATVVAPTSLEPVSAATSAGQALVTVRTQISVNPVQASAGAGALVTVATQISVDPVEAVSGAGALVTVTAQISVDPVEAIAGAETSVIVKVRPMISIKADTKAGLATNNVTAPVLLSSV
jgi:hypothetical protein